MIVAFLVGFGAVGLVVAGMVGYRMIADQLVMVDLMAEIRDYVEGVAAEADDE